MRKPTPKKAESPTSEVEKAPVKKTQLQCPHDNPNKCEFSRRKHCPYKKEGCHFPKDRVTPWKAIGITLGGILLIAISSNWLRDCPVWANILTGIGVSLLAGVALTFVIDIPNKLKEYETSFLRALTSNNYLLHLDKSKLTALREKTIEVLYKKDYPNMPQDLIKLNEDILRELLHEPYYNTYRQNVRCKYIENKAWVQKDISIMCELCNPAGNKPKLIPIKLEHLLWKEVGKDIDSCAKIKKFSYRRDGEGEDISCTDKVKFCACDDSKEHQEHYNTLISLVGTDDGKPFMVECSTKIQVHIQYEINVKASDTTYTKRMGYAVRNLRLDYSFDDQNVELYGQLLGTMIKEVDVERIYNSSKNTLSIETFNWLLPRNGIFVVHVPKKD